jgi:hypothetical protein
MSIFQNFLNFMKNTGSSASQFSLTPSPVVPSPINFPTSSPDFDAMFRKDKIDKVVKEANKTNKTKEIEKQNKPFDVNQLLNFIKNTGSSASQFSLTPSITNKQVGDSLQQIKNFGLPTPVVPSPIFYPNSFSGSFSSSPGFNSMFRKNKINKVVKEADKTNKTPDFSDVDIKKKKYPEVTQEQLDKEIEKQKKIEDEKKIPFDANQFFKDQRKFDQQVLNQAYIAGGMSDAGKSIMEGSKVAAESVVPNMIAGTTGLLASMAKGNQALAAAFGVPISPVQRMGYYR